MNYAEYAKRENKSKLLDYEHGKTGTNYTTYDDIDEVLADYSML